MALLCFAVLAIGFYLIADEQLHHRTEETEMLSPAAPMGELLQGTPVRQRFAVDADEINSVTILFSTYTRANTATVTVGIEDAAGNRLAQTEVNAASLQDNAEQTFRFEQPVAVPRNQPLTLVLESPDGAPGNTVTAWYGSGIATARAEIAQTIPEAEKARFGAQTVEGKLCFRVQQRTALWFGAYYWYFAAAGALVVLLCFWRLSRAVRTGRSSLLLRVISAFQRYEYLMRQLVSRDFKTKYKRSVLGVFWSFLNPLLTMLVQYIVFSTLFQSGIPNFALYLLTGIVCFNFFSEATSMTLLSITGNASLITKVYVPKYIYPVSRVLSSMINLLLSLLPLLAVMLFTGTKLRPAILLLPFGLACLLALCIGMGFLLSTAMVFFRDTQFLWGVVSMLWMYLTPIFYPESIIPAQLMTLYKCNPLYHIIRFIRILLIDGVSPEPKAYALCLLVSVLPLLCGAWIFKKHQDQFVLNL